ncbi:unnamed protein product [Moneuplotes crassus]|uniref:Major facilitator superfamily (MFS) profile domain-containing protein n=1 Tax=Euplotes crassus TaxID=5936 RepID=A0AAD1XAL1_EUPCR|nr:unnamed protein product [Moneuplotes crassus]
MKDRKAFEKRYVLFLACYLLACATLTIIAPIMPYQMKEKGVPTALNSIVFCIFSFAGFLGSIYGGKYLAAKGAKFFVYSGLLGLGLSHLIYAYLSFIDDKYIFTVVIILNRCLEGWSFGLIQCMVYGVASQELAPSEFDRYARTCSATSGVGGSLSLLAGPYLFSIGGYFLPYFVLFGSFVLLAFIMYISGTLNIVEEKPTELHEALIETNDEESFPPFQYQLDLKFLLSIPTVKIGCMSILLSNVVFCYLDPIFALKMLDMGIYADTTGYIYIFLCLSYSVFGFLGGVLEIIANKKTLIISGFFAGFFGFCFIAHGAFIGANYILLIIFGLSLNGYSVIGGNTFATMYTKTELMNAGEAKGVSRKEAGGYFGGVKGSMNLIGNFIGPLISPNIYMMVGFDYACIIMGSIQILFVIFFIYMTSSNSNSKHPQISDKEALRISG